MRLGRLRITARRSMVAVAVVGLAMAYVDRCIRCNILADRHIAEVGRICDQYKRSPFSDEKLIKMVDYHSDNLWNYQRAAIYPWVRVPYRFVPYDDAGRSGEGQGAE